MPRQSIVLLSLCMFVARPGVTHAQEEQPLPAAATVTVTAKKEPVVKKLDKTVYDVSNTPRAANGTAQDVLQSTPELSVSADGQIAVKGNAQVTVLVNGNPTAMMSGSADERAAALQTMSGADIASVEVITNPSAAYNANGGAILNIVCRPSEYGKLGMGLDIQDKVDNIDNYQASIDAATGAETADPATTNGYAVTTTVSAVYLTDQITHGKWEALLGGRTERMALRVRPAQGIEQTQHWQAFNPSFHLRYAMSDKADLTLSYRRSLQMPDPRDLNPFTTYVDAQNLSRGNPGLKPQQLTSWEIGTDASAAQFTASLSAFYRTSGNTVTDARGFADNLIVTSKRNGGRASSTGITGAVTWTPDAKLRLGMDGGAYRVTLRTPDLPGLFRQNDVAGYINLRAAYSVGQDNLSLDAHGQSAGISPLGRFGATSSVNLTWKHAITSTLSLTVNANDILDGGRRTATTDTSTFRQTGFDHFVARRLYVGLVKKIE